MTTMNDLIEENKKIQDNYYNKTFEKVLKKLKLKISSEDIEKYRLVSFKTQEILLIEQLIESIRLLKLNTKIKEGILKQAKKR